MTTRDQCYGSLLVTVQLVFGCGARSAITTEPRDDAPRPTSSSSPGSGGQQPFCAEQPAKVEIPRSSAPHWITQDAHSIYFQHSRAGTIFKVDKAEMKLSVVAIDVSSRPVSARDGHVAGGFLYMASSPTFRDARLMRWPLDGDASSIEELPASKRGLWSALLALRVQSDTLVLYADGKIWQNSAADPGQFRVLTDRAPTSSTWGPVAGFLADATHVYWIDETSRSQKRLLRIDRAGGAPEVVTVASTLLGSDERYVYIGTEEGTGRVEKAGERAEMLFDDVVTLVAPTGAGVYFVSLSGDLYFAATSGALPAEPRLVAQGGPFDEDDYGSNALLVDEANVYWVSGNGGPYRASDEEGWALYRSCLVE